MSHFSWLIRLGTLYDLYHFSLCPGKQPCLSGSKYWQAILPLESTELLAGSQKTYPWTTGLPFYLCFPTSRAVALREQHRNAIEAHKAHLQEIVTEVPRISYTSIPWYMVTGTLWINFQKRHILSNSLQSSHPLITWCFCTNETSPL